MKLNKYLLDILPQIMVFVFGTLIIILLLNAFGVDKNIHLAVFVILLIVLVSNILIDYFRKYKFYNKLLKLMEPLDKKYLILEMINKPNFYEGKIFYEALYEINKSVAEKVKEYKMSTKEFKDYAEMWIHEVKIPISSLALLCHNHATETDKRFLEQIRRLDNYTNQILYYVRSENAEKDYIIREIELSEVIKNVALKNKDDLLENDIRLDTDMHGEKVLSDLKWLEFILGQIINNSIKYKKEDTSSYIKINVQRKNKITTLSIYDNGIGIVDNDLPKVFDKTFTGFNGMHRVKSTGMGLYIAKKLCDKLGHKITISSKKDEYTEVTITFFHNDYYKPND